VLFWAPGVILAEVNDAFLDMTGFSRQEVLGMSWRELTPEEFHPVSLRAIEELTTRGEATPFEKQYFRKDGSRWWGLFAPRVVGDEVVEFVLDITPRHVAEERLRESEERLRLIVENVRDYGIFTTNPQDQITEWFPGAAAVFGWTAEAAIGRPGSILFTPEDREAGVPEREVETARVRGKTPNVRWHLRRDGSRVFIEGSRTALYGVNGELRGFLIVGQDVTERRAAEERLRESAAQLRTLQAELLHVSRLSAAGEMAAALAHELNQPLTAITSAVRTAQRMLDRSPCQTELQEALDLAAEQALRAGQIVRHLREFVAKGEVEMRAEDLPGLIEEAAMLALAGTKTKGVAVKFRFDAALPPVLADRIQIQQVLVNLIRNGVEAMAEAENESGTAHRELVLTAASAGPGLVEVGVADTGPGLAPEVADRLFEAFASTKSGGMGIGLSISRSIVEAHGGRIWVESNGGGAVFRFTLSAGLLGRTD
jgi:PAS domain S-box-containing protein